MLADVDSWQTISTAPFHRDLELAVVTYDGTHVLVFPRHRGGCVSRPSQRLFAVLLIFVLAQIFRCGSEMRAELAGTV
jgi:hypothetical protein